MFNFDQINRVRNVGVLREFVEAVGAMVGGDRAISSTDGANRVRLERRLRSAFRSAAATKERPRLSTADVMKTAG